MENSIVKISLVFCIIFLFIGVSIAPGISANNALIYNKIKLKPEKITINFTVEVCGLNGEKQTVELSKEEAEEVEQLFNSIRERLNKTDTREEANEVFKEAVVELNKYGLFEGLNVNIVKKLVTGEYQNIRILKNFGRIIAGNQNNANSNFLCLTAGHATNSFIMGPLNFLSLLGLFLPDPFHFLSFIFFFFPLNLFGFMVFGDYSIGQHAVYYPAEGWIRTIGLNGLKKWDGKFYGQIKKLDFGMGGEFLGGIGFTGLRINYGFFNTLFLGSTLMIKIGPKHL
jgi:hypothetical protein